jgi:predicted DNA-binding protein
MPSVRGTQVFFPASLPLDLYTRVAALAPPENRQRAAFIRDAVERRLAELEREATEQTPEVDQ